MTTEPTPTEWMRSDALEDVFAKHSKAFREFLNERGGDWQMDAGLAGLLTEAMNEAYDAGSAEAMDPFVGNPVIGEAEKALRAFEGDVPLTRDRAERLLSMWAHNNELTDREREAVLNRFGPGAIR